MDANRSASIEAGSAVLGALNTFAQLHRNHVEQAGFVVLKSPDIPSILVETRLPVESQRGAQAVAVRLSTQNRAGNLQRCHGVRKAASAAGHRARDAVATTKCESNAHQTEGGHRTGR